MVILMIVIKQKTKVEEQKHQKRQWIEDQRRKSSQETERTRA
jgi:hypothetical protein